MGILYRGDGGLLHICGLDVEARVLNHFGNLDRPKEVEATRDVPEYGVPPKVIGITTVRHPEKIVLVLNPGAFRDHSYARRLRGVYA